MEEIIMNEQEDEKQSEEDLIEEPSIESVKKRDFNVFRSYWLILRKNKAYRLIWAAMLISYTGDWLTEIACLELLSEYSDSGLMVGFYFISRELPGLLWSSFIGVIVDALDRRKILIAVDLGRAVVVLAFLFVRGPSTLWIIFVASFFQFTLSSFFEPASNALIPQFVPHEELRVANTLSNITWSSMLLLGAALGGAVAFALGTTANFIADGVSYLLSAFCLFSLGRYPILKETRNLSAKSENWKSSVVKSFQSWKGGIVYLWKNRYFFLLALAKASGTLIWAGMEISVIEFAKSHPINNGFSLSLGLLYMSSGLGVGLGPLFLGHFIPDKPKNNLLVLWIGFVCLGVGSVLMSFIDNFAFFALANTGRTIGSGLIWIYSSTLLHRSVSNDFTGRVFAFEFGCFTLTSVVARLAYGLLMDKAGMSANELSLLFGLVGCAKIIPWGIFAWWANRRIIKDQTTSSNPQELQSPLLEMSQVTED